MLHCLPLLIALTSAFACKGNSEPAPAPAAPPTPISAKEPPVNPPIAPLVPAELAALAKANNHFALELWANASAGNLAMSPASITIALAMSWAGAKGDTAAEMRDTLRLEGETEAVLSRWGQLSNTVQDRARGLDLKLANRLYAERHYPFDTVYAAIIRQAFGATLAPVDFVGDANAARETINRWVADQTEQRITDLVSREAVNADTRLVLVNAIYFLADWVTPFDKAATHDREFRVSPAKRAMVATMHRTGRYRHARGDGAALLELPYRGGAAMYLLLPDSDAGLPELERSLSTRLAALQAKLAAETVSVALPRFTIDPPDAVLLAEPLRKLGIRLAFDRERADFTGIAKPENPRDRLYLSEVLHKAFVKVDERGTEAAAATAVLAPTGMGAPPAAVPFHADHPFLFLIVDHHSGLILFVGRVVDPRA